eukprot:CAMPEP_0194491970 /NCGR_PEP_ID=MMETSP0253-20130528/10688_1 /TAXON_ID=2966 /ORGANISM="Noctiluca scintillans" /LENGTH=260 /DNA_ID=CAMNT_0039332773 /DNA_START=15 /DNA_END=797 /DNA_ORIENTATION=-
MVGDVRCGHGGAQRSPQDLLEALQDEYPDVYYAVDDSGALQILRGETAEAESLENVSSRYCQKLELICDAAVCQMKSVIIVSHGSAVVSIAHHMKKSLRLRDVPPQGFLVATRSVQVQTPGVTGCIAKESSKGPTWSVMLSAGIKCDVQGFWPGQKSHSFGVPLTCNLLHHNLFEEDASTFRTCRSIRSLSAELDDQENREPPPSNAAGPNLKRERTRSSMEKLDRLLGTSFSNSTRPGKSSCCLGHDIFQEGAKCSTVC